MRILDINSFYYDVSVSYSKRVDAYIVWNNKNSECVEVPCSLIPTRSDLMYLLREINLFKARAKSQELREVASELHELLVKPYGTDSLLLEALRHSKVDA